jgi:hypothetical protein
MLKDRCLPLDLWEEVMKVVLYINNRVIHQSKRSTTPFEQLFKIKPNLSHLRIFGSKAYVYNFDISRRKLDDKAYEGIFIGYEDSSATYRILIRSSKKIIKSAHVIVNEGENEGVVNPSEAFSHLIDYEIQLEDETTSQGSSSGSPQPVGTSPEDQLPSSIPTSQNQNSPSVLNDEVLSDVISPTPSTTTTEGQLSDTEVSSVWRRQIP